MFKALKVGARFTTDRGNTIWRFSSECCPVCLHHREEKLKHHNQFIAVNENRFPNTTMLQCLLTMKRYIIDRLPID